MNEKTKQKFARDLLSLRDKGLPSPLVVLGGKHWVTWFRYAMLGALVWMAVSWREVPEVMWIALVMVGFFAGAVVKELTFMVMIRKRWPFTEEVTDWALVERIAAENRGGTGQGDG